MTTDVPHDLFALFLQVGLLSPAWYFKWDGQIRTQLQYLSYSVLDQRAFRGMVDVCLHDEGISTDKFHARGPCGLKELTSYKYVVAGNGQIRE